MSFPDGSILSPFYQQLKSKLLNIFRFSGNDGLLLNDVLYNLYVVLYFPIGHKTSYFYFCPASIDKRLGFIFLLVPVTSAPLGFESTSSDYRDAVQMENI
jgi:hypothetical protein